MTRTLPWKRNASSVSAPKPVTLPAKPPPADDPHVSGSPTSHSPRPVTGDEGAQAADSPYRTSSIKHRPQSSSPPPAPPEERFMINGLEGDDIWRMVEDEFLAVAGTFTTHLHRAEYKRLKRLAESQNAETISTISRPVAYDRTDTVKRRQDREELERRQGGAIKRMRGSGGRKPTNDSDDEDGPSPWAGTALQGLMDSPRKKAPRLLSDVVKKATVINAPALRNVESSTKTQPRSLSHNTRPSFRDSNRSQGADNDQTTQSEDDSDDDLDAAPAYLHDRKQTGSTVDLDSHQGRRLNPKPIGAGSIAITRQSETDAKPVGAPASSPALPHTEHDDSDSSDGILAQARKRRERLRGKKRSEVPGNATRSREGEKKTDTAVDVVPYFI